MARKDDDLEKKYAKLLESRQKNVNRNIAEGRTLGVSSTPEVSSENKRAIDELYDRILAKREDKLMKNVEMGRSINLAGTLPIAEAKGNKISNLSNEIKKDFGDNPGIRRDIALAAKNTGIEDVPSQSKGLLSGKMGKTLKALGILAPGIAAMGIGEKAMAGDLGGAGVDAADLATDYIPGVGQVKDAIRPEEMGNSELPFEEMEARRIFNEEARKGKMGEPTRHPSFKNEELSTKEQPVSEKELSEEIRKKFNVFNKMK